MKTSEALYKQFGKKFVRVEQIASEFLGINSEKTARERAAKNDLNGVVAFRLRDREGAPWLVDIDQLAEVLDHKLKTARK